MNVSRETYLRWAIDPALWVEERLGISPDPKQKDILRSRSKRMLLCCSRQWGKTTVCSWVGADGGIFHPGTFTIIVAPVFRQSVELLDKITTIMDTAEVALKEKKQTELILHNGSRILALPGDGANIRGFSAVHRVIIDEAAFIPGNAKLMEAVRPMLATTGGALKLLSTPNGKSGHFFEWWQNGGPDWERFKVTADDCPRIAREFLDGERNDLAPGLFMQEYYCEFLDTIHSVFLNEDTRDAISDAVEPLFKIA